MSSGRKDQVTPHRYDMSPQGEGTKEGTREGPAAVASPTSRQPRGPDEAAAAWAGRGGSRVGRTRRQPRGPDEAAAASSRIPLTKPSSGTTVGPHGNVRGRPPE